MIQIYVSYTLTIYSYSGSNKILFSLLFWSLYTLITTHKGKVNAYRRLKNRRKYNFHKNTEYLNIVIIIKIKYKLFLIFLMEF